MGVEKGKGRRNYIIISKIQKKAFKRYLLKHKYKDW